MKLLPKAILKALPAIGTTSALPADKVKIPLKIFNPGGAGTWYITEFNPATGEAFGLADVHEKELGYISLEELQAFRGRFGLPLERDLHWNPSTTLADVMK